MASVQDVITAFSGFKEATKTLRTERALRKAQTTVEAVRAEETNQFKIQQGVKAAANQLALDLMQANHTAAFAKAASGFIDNPERFFQTPEQALMNADPESQPYKAARSLRDEDIQIKREATAATRAFSREKYQTSADIRRERINNQVARSLDPSSEVRTALGRMRASLDTFTNVRGLIGPDTTDEALDKLQAPQVHEIAQGIIRGVKQGIATKEEIDHFVPPNIQQMIANGQEFLFGNLPGAQRKNLIKMYLKTTQREAAIDMNKLHRDVLVRAQGSFETIAKSPQVFRNQLSKILDIAPEDVIIDRENKLITTRQLRAQRSLQAQVMANLPAYQKALAEGTPKEKAAAEKFFKKWRLDPTLPAGQQRQEIRFLVMMDAYADQVDKLIHTPKSRFE